MNGNIFSWYGMSHPGMEIILSILGCTIHEIFFLHMGYPILGWDVNNPILGWDVWDIPPWDGMQ
jgi:hypothetical protein